MDPMVRWTWGKICLATAASALGAALLFANSPLFMPKRQPFVLKRLEQALLKRLDGSNQIVRAGDLWKDNGAVIMAVRRPG